MPASPRGTPSDSTTPFAPVTAIPFLFRGKAIRSWGGPGKGTIEMDGAQWLPYQAATNPTPPFPDYVSGHSAYSAAAAEILQLWTGNSRFGNSATLPAGSSKIEPGVTLDPRQKATSTVRRMTCVQRNNVR
jgi:vanadium-dependent haloperoxidase-like protein